MCFSKELELYKMQFVYYDLLYRRLMENYRERVRGCADEVVSFIGIVRTIEIYIIEK